MCGFITALDFQKSIDDESFAAALGTLKHRGPDYADSIISQDKNVRMGHTRLKIIDLSDAANQPYLSECGRFSLVFNGEIYNFRELRHEIGGRWNWRTDSDTEVVMAAWSIWREKCLSKLVGMFAFVIHDRALNLVYGVRDRFGIKPFYYSVSNECIYLASEILCLLQFVEKIPNLDIINTYLTTGLYDHSDQTFFQDIMSLSPGHFITLNVGNGEVEFKKWYNLSENIPSLDQFGEDELLDFLDELVLSAVSSNLVSDVDIGVNFSGGVDSTMLLACAAELNYFPKLFNQNYEIYSELEWVNGLPFSNELYVSEISSDSVLSDLHTTVISQAEPFGGVTVCGYNQLYRSARKENVKVLLDGNGVDEVFLGYEKYRSISQTYKSTVHGKTTQKILSRSIDGTNGLRPSAIGEQLAGSHIIQGIEDGKFADCPVKDLAYRDLLSNKIPRGLRFNDRVSMAHSCELRVPFLDHRLVEFGFAVPSHMLINDLGSKALFRKLLARKGLGHLALAPKRSVQSSQREWLSGVWSPLVRELINSKQFQERGWVDTIKAQHLFDEYLAGRNENSFFIWQWINLELWAKHFFDGEFGK